MLKKSSPQNNNQNKTRCSRIPSPILQYIHDDMTKDKAINLQDETYVICKPSSCRILIF